MARAPQSRLSVSEYRELAQSNPLFRALTEKPRKFHNSPTIYNSIQGFERRYDSKKEAAFAFGLDHTEGWWIPQVPFPLPGGVTYRADFMHVGADGKPRFYDVKGRDTQASINKRKQVFALYGITVELA